jgi:hypothetical protein
MKTKSRYVHSTYFTYLCRLQYVRKSIGYQNPSFKLTGDILFTIYTSVHNVISKLKCDAPSSDAETISIACLLGM